MTAARDQAIAALGEFKRLYKVGVAVGRHEGGCTTLAMAEAGGIFDRVDAAIANLRAECGVVRARTSAIAALEAIEHLPVPCTKITRCPVCRSPNDMSEPHEYGCAIELALTALRAEDAAERRAAAEERAAIVA